MDVGFRQPGMADVARQPRRQARRGKGSYSTLPSETCKAEVGPRSVLERLTVHRLNVPQKCSNTVEDKARLIGLDQVGIVVCQ